jgi:hypothetical protein
MSTTIINLRKSEIKGLLRRIEARDQQCAYWMVQVIEKIACAYPAMTIKEMLMQVIDTLPQAGLTERERELLCQKSSESMTATQLSLRVAEVQPLSV